jgi:hypothetical protein
MVELFPELLVFAFLSLSSLFGCERGRIGKSSRLARAISCGELYAGTTHLDEVELRDRELVLWLD